MYLNPNPRKDHVYYNVVESVWEDGTSQKNQLMYIGRLDDLSPDERREIEEELLELDPSLLPDFYEALIEHDYDFSADEELHSSAEEPEVLDEESDVAADDAQSSAAETQSQYPLEDITVKRALDYGPVAALHAIAEKLGLEAILNEQLQPKGGGPPLGKLLLLQIIGHCIEPRSINKTTDWYPLTALPGLLDLPTDQFTSAALYNSLDYITEDGRERVHEELWTRVQELYDTPEDPLFYDLTSSYFEGTQCPLAAYGGYSSDHRPDKQQIWVGVTVNPDMVPLQHDVYTGNTNNSKTVDDAADRVVELGIDDPVLVMDKGCATNPNREDLRHGDLTTTGEQIDYVAALKNDGNVPDLLASIDPAEFDRVELPDGASPVAVTEVEPPDDLAEEGVRWIATYNEEKADDDADSRDEKLTEAGEDLDELVDRQYGNRPLSKEDLLERIDSKLTNTMQELLTIEINERGPPRLSWEVDDEAVKEAARLDGKAMFETSRAAEDLSAAAVARAYRDRDTVEKFMESVKDMAHLRPHHVYTDQHVRARVFICVLSVLLIAVLQLELDSAGKEMTGLKALEILRGVRRVELSVEADEAIVTKTTELSDDQQELMHLFDLGT